MPHNSSQTTEHPQQNHQQQQQRQQPQQPQQPQQQQQLLDHLNFPTDDEDDDQDENGSWEVVSSANDSDSTPSPVPTRHLRGSASTPDFTIVRTTSEDDNDDESSSSFVLDCPSVTLTTPAPTPTTGDDDDDINDDANGDTVMTGDDELNLLPSPSLTRRTPSFRDAILLNAAEVQREEVEAVERKRKEVEREALVRREGERARRRKVTVMRAMGVQNRIGRIRRC